MVVGGSAGGRVRVYDPRTGAVLAGPRDDFGAFGPGYAGGVFVGTDRAGDVNGDAVPDLAVGTGAGVTARVKVFSGETGAVLYGFQPFGSGFTGGARVALAYADDDARADIVVGTGPGTAAQVKVFSGATGAQLAAPPGAYAPFGSSRAGTFVGASNDPLAPSAAWTAAPASAKLGQVVRGVVRVGGRRSPRSSRPARSP